jgi:DNA-binding protein YbaB
MTGPPSFELGELGSDALEDGLGEVRGDPATAAGDLQGALADIRGTGTSSDVAVEAVMSPGGALLSLTVDPRLLRKGSEVVAETVREAVNAASDEARSQVHEVLRQRANPVTKAAAGLQRGLDNVIDQVLTDVARVQNRIR